jgi:hypothetical protein
VTTRMARAWFPATFSLAAGVFLLGGSGSAQDGFFVKAVAEKKITKMPGGALYWRIESFPTLAEAQAAATPMSLGASIEGRNFLFTLARKDATQTSPAGATKVAKIGPVPIVAAPVYLLRVNHAGGPPGSETASHTHPGSEAFYVLAGRLGQRTRHGTSYADAGQTMNGHHADMPMVVFSAGQTDLSQLVMFVVDATRPFSSPATLP